jgi:hypothetical protein
MEPKKGMSPTKYIKNNPFVKQKVAFFFKAELMSMATKFSAFDL